MKRLLSLALAALIAATPVAAQDQPSVGAAVAEAQAREPAAAMPALIRAALRLLAPKD